MRKFRQLAAFVLLAPALAAAQGPPEPFPPQGPPPERIGAFPGEEQLFPDPHFFGRPDVPLDLHDTSVLNLSREWQQRAVPAFLGRNGAVIYHYGESVATVITSPGNVTAIQLQPGEVLSEESIFIGDSVNWLLAPALQGTPEDPVTHIIVKPKFTALETTMIVVTNRRLYHFHLKSTDGEHMASIAFQYPMEQSDYMAEYLRKIRSRREQEQEQRQVPLPGGEQRDISKLDFSYSVTATGGALTPTRIYDDSIQVYIQMPDSMGATEAPAFLDLSHPSPEIVNYRLKGNTYIVDKLFTKGMLVSGSGKTPREVLIEYTGTQAR